MTGRRQGADVERVPGVLAQEPPADAEVLRRRRPGERPRLVAEVGLVVEPGAVRDLAPVDRAARVDRPHGGHEAVRPREPLRRQSDDLREAPREVRAAHAGRRAELADRHRARGRREHRARVADEREPGRRAEPSQQLFFEQLQHLVRRRRRGQPLAQLDARAAAPDVLDRHRPVAQLGRRHR
jgi:hypothetical protein